MKIIHSFSLAARDGESRAFVIGLGLRPKEHPLISTFEIDESDPRWPAVAEWSEHQQYPGIARTVFTHAEIAAARWLTLSAWHHGYPQPDEGSFGYRQATYDLSDWCPECGIGMRQVAPFQMKGEPAWGRNSLLQMIWVFDEIFATPELWQSVFQRFGVGLRPVLGPRGQELATVVQLVVERTVPVVTDGLDASRCPVCGRVKYMPVVRGFFPHLAAEPEGAAVKTDEYFGSGAEAHREILVNAEIAKALRTGRVKGATLTPVAP
jgi:rRNA maturation protein Nop10